MTYLSLFLIPSTLCLITPLFTIICLIECLITCFHYRMTTTSSFYLSPIWCIYRGLRATFNTTHESSFSDLIFRSTLGQFQTPTAFLSSISPLTRRDAP